MLGSKIDFRRINFVHNALPDLSLTEIDTSLDIRELKIKIKFPIFIILNKREDAKRISAENKDIPILTKVNNELDIYTDGTGLRVPVGNYRFEKIEDGLEAAKALRAGVMPFIEASQMDDFELYMKQLRIAMFLTDSKNIAALKKAPIYKMG